MAAPPVQVLDALHVTLVQRQLLQAEDLLLIVFGSLPDQLLSNCPPGGTINIRGGHWDNGAVKSGTAG